ncbi:Membrane-bound lytic murein transglycosylase D [Coxiella burnetii str. Namibia]|nr:transglycosylase SLT domain-containing protein [Coxiella burnetii]AIT63242.1 Membrane-bound lytic murein transglycosylase D [Coxiella burnetii str. Namibia]
MVFIRVFLLLSAITSVLLLGGNAWGRGDPAKLHAEIMAEVQSINSSLHEMAVKTAIASQKPAARAANLWPIMTARFALADESKRPEVRHELMWFLSHPQTLHQMLTNAIPYIYYVYQQTQQRHMPAEFALMPMLESGYNPFAYSNAGATGLWQMMPGTASSFGLEINWWYDGRRDTVVSTQAALNYLCRLHGSFQNWILATAAYDAGMGAVRAAQQYNQREGQSVNFWNLPLPQETRDYVPKLLALAIIIKHAAYYHVKLPYIPARPYFFAVNMNSQIDRAEAARRAGVSSSVIRQLNPAMRRWASDPDGVYTLLIPYEKREVFQRNLAALIGKEHTTWQYHEVRSGETLQSIARIYHTNIALLMKANELTTEKVSPEQGLLVPLYLHRTYSAPVGEQPATVASTQQQEEGLKQLLDKIYSSAPG